MPAQPTLSPVVTKTSVRRDNSAVKIVEEEEFRILVYFRASRLVNYSGWWLDYRVRRAEIRADSLGLVYQDFQIFNPPSCR